MLRFVVGVDIAEKRSQTHKMKKSKKNIKGLQIRFACPAFLRPQLKVKRVIIGSKNFTDFSERKCKKIKHLHYRTQRKLIICTPKSYIRECMGKHKNVFLPKIY